MEASKDKIASFAPALQSAAEGLATRFAMLFDEKGREALLTEIKGYLKYLLAELMDLMSGTLLGKSLGASKTKAAGLRAEADVDTAKTEQEVALRKKEIADKSNVPAEREAADKALVDADKKLAAAKENASKNIKLDTPADYEKLRQQNAREKTEWDKIQSAPAEAIEGIGKLLGYVPGLGFVGDIAQSARESRITQEADILKERREGTSATGMSRGGIVNVPRSGQLVALHGKEAVVPLPDGRSIPVSLKDSNSYAGGAESVNNSELINQVSRLNEFMARLVTINMDQQDILDRQLRIAKDMNPLS